jgi:hypothetical protein
MGRFGQRVIRVIKGSVKHAEEFHTKKSCLNGLDINDAMHMCINLKGRIRMGLVPFERERASGHAKHSSPKDENGES